MVQFIDYHREYILRTRRIYYLWYDMNCLLFSILHDAIASYIAINYDILV